MIIAIIVKVTSLLPHVEGEDVDDDDDDDDDDVISGNVGDVDDI